MHKTHLIARDIILDAAPAVLPRLHLCRFARLAAWQAEDLSAPWWRFYLAVDPGASVAWRGRSMPLRPGEAMLIAPDTAFASASTAPFRKAYAHFTWQPAGRVALPGIHRVGVGAAMVRRLVADADPGVFACRMLGLLGQACAGLPTGVFTAAHRPGALVRQAQALLAADGPPPANAAVAARLGIHPHSLGRLFVAETGRSPQAWAREQRLLRAAEMLAGSSESIAAIAERCGFWDRNHFTRAFIRRWQCGPAAFRRRERPEDAE